MKKCVLGVIGFGNMAYAIINGVLTKNVLDAQDICVYDVDEAKRNVAKQKNLCVADSLQELADCSKYLLFSVKPQSFPDVAKSFSLSNQIIISIMAGVKKEKLSKLTRGGVARVMPNTPALVGEAMCAVDCGGLFDDQKSFIIKVLSSIGKVIEVEEKEMDAVTAVSGSGPAYVFRFIKAMADAGEKLGLSPDTARLLATQTVLGAAKLAMNADQPLNDLIQSVCSKGGTTIEAMNVFNEGDALENLVDRAMVACYHRSEELSRL